MASLPKHLPTPDQEALLRSQQLAQLIQSSIQKAGGWISFAEFMQMALYTPGLGYYTGGNKKLGAGGDFITAPEISPLFAYAIARQYAQLQATSLLGSGDAQHTLNILELGAGSGVLAADLLLALQELQSLPKAYYILEVSDHLRQVQRETSEKKLPAELFKKLIWLETLPPQFSGLVLANEVLDAIPVHLLQHSASAWLERGVSHDVDFFWQDRPLSNAQLINAVNAHVLPEAYLTEVCPAAQGLVTSLAEMLTKGVILLIDYGFGASEYYHPQRSQGTLMCHFQHYAHSNPLIYPGLQDITAHVNFTEIAEAATQHELALAGYTSQAQFLMNCGILERLAETSPEDLTGYAPMVAAVQKLLSPAEMGDLFKVIAFSKQVDTPLLGFSRGDKSHLL
jgi:SAM-dependent MidA family methyltransferase